MSKLSVEQQDQIIKLYQQGMASTAIAAQFGIYSNSVARVLRRKGIDRTRSVRVPPDQIAQIIQEYSQGVSSEVIGKKLNINGSTVCRILKRNGITPRPDTQNKRQYKITENYFETISTEEKAYFLGFMYADGNLSKTSNGIRLCLQAEDRDILEKFSNVIYGFIKLRPSFETLDNGRVREYLSANIYCKKMHDDLKKLGCPPKKTFIIRFPNEEIVPKNLLRHFVRGYFDGDGCISIATISHPVVDFSSNFQFIASLIPYLEDNNVQCGKLCLNKENPESANVQLTGNDNITNFYHFLYDNATIFMNRKYNTFQELIQFMTNKTSSKTSKHLDPTLYGTTYIPEYKGQILTANNVKQLSDQDKEQAAEQLLEFYREHGFPYAQLSNNDLIKNLTALKSVNPASIEKDHVLSICNQAGLPIFKHFAPQFYEVNSGTSDRLSMLDTFNRDDLLKRVIKNRLDGGFNMTGNMLKQGLGNSKIAYKASVFNPMVAKFIYSRYTQANDIIYDYSMGFGQRLIAALSLSHPITYIGVDPMQRSVKSNQNIFDFFSHNIPLFNKKAEIICEGSENYCDPKYQGQITLAFSSPPYFNLEKYEDRLEQAYHDDNYVQFINSWWRKTAANIFSLLKPSGIMALNIKDKVDGFDLANDMCNILKEYGFQLIDTYQIQLSRNDKFMNAKGKLKYEPIYVFQK